MADPTGGHTGSTSSPVRPNTARRAASALTGADPVAGAAGPRPPRVVQVSAAAPSAMAPSKTAPSAPAPREGQALFYGLLVVLAGFVAILIGLLLVVINYKVASEATAILGIITTAIAGLGGAFFGVTLGQQGTASANKQRAAAEAAKDEAQLRTLKFAANMDPAVARRLVE